MQRRHSSWHPAAASANLNEEARWRADWQKHRLIDVATPLERKQPLDFYVLQLQYGADLRYRNLIFANGVTPTGHSVCVAIYGFSPFFYLRRRDEWSDDDCARLVEALERALHAGVSERTVVEESDSESDSDEEEDAKPKQRREKKPHQRTVGFSQAEMRMLAAHPRWLQSWTCVRGSPYREYLGLNCYHTYLRIELIYPKLVSLARQLLEHCSEMVVGSRVPTLVPEKCTWLPADLPLSYVGGTEHAHVFELFEAHIEYVIRFLVSRQLKPATWWHVNELALTSHEGASRRFTTDHEAWAHVDALSTVPVSQLGPLPGKTLQNTLPNALVMDMDSEWILKGLPAEAAQLPEWLQALKGHFPSAKRGDPPMIISFSLYRMWKMDVRRDYVFIVLPAHDATLRRDLIPDEIEVYLCSSTTELLQHFRACLVGLDPDFVIGFNSNNFDWRSLLEAATLLDLRYSFARLGRMPLDGHGLYATAPRVTRGKTKVDVHIGGRVVLDFFRWACSPGPAKDFTSLTLDGVAGAITGQTKVDIPPDRIGHFYALNTETRSRLASYASVDTQLLHEMDKRRWIVAEYLEEGRCCGVPPQHVHDRGSEYIGEAALLWFMQSVPSASARLEADKTNARLVIPTRRRDRVIVKEGKYEGADVRKPTAGFYEDPVVTLDFESLYPRQMQQRNMCRSTKFTDPAIIEREGLVEGRDFTRRPKLRLDAKSEMIFNRDTMFYEVESESDLESACYLTPQCHLGVVSRFLDSLGGLRAELKRQMAEVTAQMEAIVAEMKLVVAEMRAYERDGRTETPEYRALGERLRSLSDQLELLNIRQTKIKTRMNSTYGTFGSPTSPTSDIEIASDVTFGGRALIRHVGWLAENLFTRANGWLFNAQVIYGDTDSIMVHMPGCPKERAHEMGKRMTGVLNQYVQKPNRLAYEKFYMPMLLMKKKKYAGLKHTPGQSKASLEIKGMGAVKRDTCAFVRRVSKQALTLLIVEGSRERALAFAQHELGVLARGRARFSELIMSRSLSNDPDKYAVKDKNKRKITAQPHVQLARRMAKLEPDNAPRAGDRISYVMCCTAESTAKDRRKQTKGDKVRTPLEAMQQSLPLDLAFYVENSRNELTNIFYNLYGAEHTESLLFHGEHMRQRTRVELSLASPLALFLQSAPSCDSCNSRLPLAAEAARPLCEVCMPRAEEVRASARCELEEAQARRGECLATCQSCVGARGTPQEIEDCTSVVCTNQWERLQARKDVVRAEKRMSRWH